MPVHWWPQACTACNLLATVSGSAFGDTQSQQNLRDGAGATYDFVKDPNNWPQLLGVMGATDREKLAQAYERGDGKAVGQLMGAQLANLPMGGGAGMLGTIGKVDKAAEVATAAGKVVKGLEAVEDAAKVASKLPDSPVDIAHTIGADYNARTGKVTGGHSTLNGDVKVTEIVSPPDANGVYEATVQMKTPQGDWMSKTSNGGRNTMFPQTWDAPRIQAEIDSAWVGRAPHPDGTPNKWTGISASGVTIEGFEKPRATAYPIYGGAK
ncbi:hypothetical protein os1_40460 [Comamonadaceae bacterium OS-1]|nr:hypothetical protein os1_40460 [Comamonadaceae bacterium OS-1]